MQQTVSGAVPIAQTSNPWAIDRSDGREMTTFAASEATRWNSKGWSPATGPALGVSPGEALVLASAGEGK